MRAISAVDSVSPAIQRTREFLFRPFTWGTYLKLGLVAIISLEHWGDLQERIGIWLDTWNGLTFWGRGVGVYGPYTGPGAELGYDYPSLFVNDELGRWEWVTE